MDEAPAEPAADEAADHAYFQAIEELLVRLRGAPLLLAPADWQVASRWHRRGVPLDLVARTMEELFAKRRERGAQGRINSLRYCAPAVEAAWEELRELTAPAIARRRRPSTPLGGCARFPSRCRTACLIVTVGRRASRISPATARRSRSASRSSTVSCWRLSRVPSRSLSAASSMPPATG